MADDDDPDTYVVKVKRRVPPPLPPPPPPQEPKNGHAGDALYALLHPDAAVFETQRFSLLVRNKKKHKDADPAQILRFNDKADLARFPDRVILASTSPRPYHYRLVCNSERAIREMLSATLQPQDFYYIESERPVRCYFDFDCGTHELLDEHCEPAQFVVDCANTIAYFCCYVDALLMRPTRAYYDGQWRLYSACTADKLSVHAHADLTFASVDVLRSVVARFVKLMALLQEHGFEGAPRFFKRNGRSVLDAFVYTRRPFRLPLNRKTQCTANYLWPAPLVSQLAPDDRPAFHLAAGFIHPDARLHPQCTPDTVLPADLLAVRRAQARLIGAYEARWPLADWAQLHAFLAELVAVSTGTGTTQCTITADQLAPQHFFGPNGAACHTAATAVFLDAVVVSTAKNSSDRWPDRRSWLGALCAVAAVLDARRQDDYAQRLHQLLLASFEFGAAPTLSWGERQHQFLSIFGLAFPAALAPPPQTQANNKQQQQQQPCDFVTEFAFSAFYMRAVHYYRTCTHLGTREQLIRFLSIGDGADAVAWPAVDSSCRRWLAEYTWFRRLPAELFSTPAQAVTLDRLQQLCDVDPLLAAAPPATTTATMVAGSRSPAATIDDGGFDAFLYF